MSNPLRVGVIGLGAMGRQHVRVWTELADVDLAGVCDLDAGAVERCLKGRSAPGYTAFERMLDEVPLDAVSVAVPTTLHEAVATFAMEQGVAVLIEKPLADHSDSARRLITCAERTGVVAGVGHIERFNPAFRELERRLAAEQIGQIFQIKARRTGPTAMRVSDVGVTLDLATHELDIVCRLVQAPLLQLYAQTARRVRSAHEDLFTALLRFADGTVALLDVNWLTPSKIRELWVTGERGTFVVDYLMQDLTFHENSDAPPPTFDASPAVARVSEGNAIRYAIERVEPLRAQLEAFAAAVRANGDPPVPLRDGLLAVQLAELALYSAATGQAMDLDDQTPLSELAERLAGASYRGTDPLVTQ